MKIAIVGGGWVGCHLASRLKDHRDVTLFEKRDRLFSQTSYHNQNRLHLGFHYARNFYTRELCRASFDFFMSDYGEFTSSVDNNYYCVSSKSHIDFKTYLKIFDDFKDVEVVDNPFGGIEGTINTNERYINFHKLSQHFNSTLNIVTKFEEVTSLEELAKNYDLVVNCTNNFLNKLSSSFYEIALTFIYQKIKETEFDAVTVVDGDFFSIYPYDEGRYTLTDVEHTPIARFESAEKVNSFFMSKKEMATKRELFEKKVLNYYPEFLQHFTYDDYFLSVKSKRVSDSANRYPVIDRKGNIINCYTGKIQGIYSVEEYILNYFYG